jgi:hypothetical protein
MLAVAQRVEAQTFVGILHNLGIAPEHHFWLIAMKIHNQGYGLRVAQQAQTEKPGVEVACHVHAQGPLVNRRNSPGDWPVQRLKA